MNASVLAQPLCKLRSGSVRRRGDQANQRVRNIAMDQRAVASTSDARSESPRLAMKPQYPAHCRVPDAEQLRNLGIGLSLVAESDDCPSHAQRCDAVHPLLRSCHADQVNCFLL
jgi:hypothetical protein